MRRSTLTRAGALRQARQARSRRDAEWVERERRVEAALADFFEASGQAEQIRTEATTRAERIMGRARDAAAVPQAAAGRAVRALRELTDSHSEVAGLCGLSVGAVRTILAADETGPERKTGPGRVVRAA